MTPFSARNNLGRYVFPSPLPSVTLPPFIASLALQGCWSVSHPATTVPTPRRRRSRRPRYDHDQKGPSPSQSVRARGGGVASPAPAFTAWNLPLFMLRSFCLSCPGKRFRRGATPTTSTSTPTMSAPARVRCGASQPSVLRRSTGGRCTRRRAATATRSARSSSQPVSPAIALITTFIVVVIVHND